MRLSNVCPTRGKGVGGAFGQVCSPDLQSSTHLTAASSLCSNPSSDNISEQQVADETLVGITALKCESRCVKREKSSRTTPVQTTSKIHPGRGLTLRGRKEVERGGGVRDHRKPQANSADVPRIGFDPHSRPLRIPGSHSSKAVSHLPPDLGTHPLSSLQEMGGR